MDGGVGVEVAGMVLIQSLPAYHFHLVGIGMGDVACPSAFTLPTAGSFCIIKAGSAWPRLITQGLVNTAKPLATLFPGNHILFLFWLLASLPFCVLHVLCFLFDPLFFFLDFTLNLTLNLTC